MKSVFYLGKVSHYLSEVKLYFHMDAATNHY